MHVHIKNVYIKKERVHKKKNTSVGHVVTGMSWPHQFAIVARVGLVGRVVSGMSWPHRLAFVARVGPVGCVVSGILAHRLAFVARVGHVACWMCDVSQMGQVAPPTRVCSEGGACGICCMNK
jgi:hypothetical protein